MKNLQLSVAERVLRLYGLTQNDFTVKCVMANVVDEALSRQSTGRVQ